MKSAWKVTSNSINGKKVYGVYRIRDVAEVDHSGNREMFGGYMDHRYEAIIIAEKLNDAESKEVRE